MRRPFLVVLGTLLASASRLPAQPPPSGETPTFPARAELVVVDVVVADRKGGPVTGLTASDFTVTEDGVPQTISSFEAVTIPPPGPSLPPPPAPGVAPARVSTNTAPSARRGRSFVIVFDDMNVTPARASQAKAAVAEFLRQGVREDDRVLLVATSGSTWWSARMEAGREELVQLVKRLEARYVPDTGPERMTDHEALRIHVYHDTLVWDRVARRFETYGVAAAAMREQEGSRLPGMGNAYVAGRAFEVYSRATSRLKTTLEVVQRALDAMAAVKGRKSLVLVSEGFILDTSDTGPFRKVVQASRRANVAVYFVDSRGLEALPSVFGAEFGPPVDDRDVLATLTEAGESSEGASVLASDTGGFSVRNTNALAEGIQRIARESEAYYLVGYQPTNAARDGKFRKIEVKVARRGIQVRARKGYYAPAEGAAVTPVSPTPRDPVLQTALDSPWEIEGVPLRTTSFVFEEESLGKANVVVATDVDVRGLAFEEQGDRHVDALEFLLVVAHRETGEFFRYDQTVDLKLQAATRDRLNRTWFALSRDFQLVPGGYQAKVVVRDRNSGKVGAVIHDFEVPPLGSLRVSTPVLSDAVEPPKAGDQGVPVPILKVDRTFPTRGTLYVQFDVYDAATDPATRGLPRVSSAYEIRRSDGVVLARARPSIIVPTSLGQLSRVSGIPLRGASPGDYELVLTVADEIAGKDLVLKEPFRLTAGE